MSAEQNWKFKIISITTIQMRKEKVIEWFFADTNWYNHYLKSNTLYHLTSVKLFRFNFQVTTGNLRNSRINSGIERSFENGGSRACSPDEDKSPIGEWHFREGKFAANRPENVHGHAKDLPNGSPNRTHLQHASLSLLIEFWRISLILWCPCYFSIRHFRF